MTPNLAPAGSRRGRTDEWAGARRTRFGPFNWLSTKIRPANGLPRPASPHKQFAQSDETTFDTVGAVILACIAAGLTWLTGFMLPWLSLSPLDLCIMLLSWLDGMVGIVAWIVAAIVVVSFAYRAFDGYNPQINQFIKQAQRTHSHTRHGGEDSKNPPGFYTRRAVFVVFYYFEQALTDNNTFRMMRRALAFAFGWSLWLYVAPLGSLFGLLAIGLLLDYLMFVIQSKTKGSGDDEEIKHAAARTLFGVRRLLVVALLAWWAYRIFF